SSWACGSYRVVLTRVLLAADPSRPRRRAFAADCLGDGARSPGMLLANYRLRRHLVTQEGDEFMDKSFLTDIKELRRRARSHIEKGAVTEGYRADRTTVLRLLNEALATEIVCVLRYKRHYYTAAGIHAQAVAAEFLKHAGEEQQHADQIAER